MLNMLNLNFWGDYTSYIMERMYHLSSISSMLYTNVLDVSW